ncbi:MAG: alpha/beta fold hydrolase [Bacteroidales bacterium]|nr:alpha/beta fold hydrolase [Bacteroidales bacterium]
MNKIIFLIAAILFGFQLKAQDAELCKNKSMEIIQQFQNSEIESIYNQFTTKMQESISLEQLSSIWPAFTANDGNFLGHEEQKAMEIQGYQTVETTIIFEKKAYKFKLSFDKEYRIAGMFFVPMRINRNDNQDNTFWEEKELFVKSKDARLPATFCKPKNSDEFPVVVFVHGSGPNDRDETIGPNRIFADLAHALAQKGIGSIRYDKRTYHKIVNGDDVPVDGLQDVVVEDAVAAIELAAKLVGPNNKVFLIGHSLGATMAPIIAKQSKLLSGIIMMAPSAFPLEDEVYRQTKYLMKRDGLSCKDRKELRLLKKKVKNVKNLEAFLQQKKMPDLPLTNDTSLWRDLSRINPQTDILNLQIPVYILQGERDYQVTMDSFEQWKKLADGKKNMEFKSYPELNHIFHQGSGLSYPEEYQVSGNLPDYLTSDISLWILSKNQ